MHPTLRLVAACTVSGDSKSAWYDRVEKGLMVQPVRVGPRAAGWPADEVAAVVTLRNGGGSEAQIRALVRHLHAERERAAQRILESIVEPVAA